MLPVTAIAGLQTRDMRCANAVGDCDFAVQTGIDADSFDLRLGQLVREPSLAIAIAIVVLPGAEEEMRGVDAGCTITSMKNALAFRNRPDAQFIRCDVGSTERSVDLDETVPGGIARTKPDPTPCRVTSCAFENSLRRQRLRFFTFGHGSSVTANDPAVK